MRLYLLLILIAVSMAFSAGYLSLSLREVPPSIPEFSSQIRELKSDFQGKHEPVAEFYPTRDWIQNYLYFFHAPELAGQGKRAKIAPADLNVLTRLDARAMRGLAKRQAMVLTPRSVLFRVSHLQDHYRVYE